MVLPSVTLRLGTRGSLLARTQSGLVAEELRRRHPGLKIEMVLIKTTGDQITDRPLSDAGGKGLFTKELEQALLGRQVDFAVHSFKDVPVTMPLVDTSSLVMAAVPTREDPRDVLVCATARRLGELARGARVGTGSLRRRCQILAMREDLVVEPLRGNIDTRLRKCREGQFDAVILAMAGLVRSGLFEAGGMSAIETDELLPAAGQGALALQCRGDDQQTRQVLGVLDDPATRTCVEAERGIVAALGGDCHSPIAALGRMEHGQIHLQAAVGARNGHPPVVRAEATGSAGDVVRQVYELLREQGVEQ